MLRAARAAGLAPSPQIVAQLKEAADKDDYVRVRYMVTEEGSEVSAEKVLRLVGTVRDCVRQALGFDELGMRTPKAAVKEQANHAKRPLRRPANSALKSG